MAAPTFQYLQASPGTALAVMVSGLNPDGTNFQLATFDFPSAATPLNATSGNVANGAAVATIGPAAGQFTWVTGFEITAAGATAASVVTASLTGLAGANSFYTYAVPAGVTTQGPILVVEFAKPVRSSAVNTAITLTLPALGAGNTNAVVNLHGFTM